MTIDETEKIKTAVEIKDYIVQLVNAVTKTMIEAFENLKIEDVNMFQLVYNKAIDDFIRKCETESRVILDEIIHLSYYGLSMRELQRIAEQLKAGGENERM